MGPHEALKASGRAASPGLASVRIRSVLVAAEVALALVLLVGTGLMLRSAWRIHTYPPGFEPERVLTATIELTGPQYRDAHQRGAFARSLLERLGNEPGVEAAGLTTHGSALTMALRIEGETLPAPGELARKPPIVLNATTPALQHVLGLRVVRGRWLKEDEPAVVLNESLVSRDFPGRDPIGRRIQLNDKGPPLTIVGVVEDVKYSRLDAAAEPELFVPYSRLEYSLFEFTVLLLTSNDPSAFAARIRTAISDLDETQVPNRVMTLAQVLGESVAPRRLNLALFSTFAAAALFLAVIGIYGVMAYAVAQRGREIGVRIALGAQRADVVSMVVRQGMRVTLAGIAAGVAGALLLTRFMETLLFEVRPTDPSTFVAVIAVLAVTGLLACCGPALKAALVDPVETLRSE
jgi:putative ABC transport system permease protein